MSLPPPVINRISQAATKEPGWFGQLFIFSIAVFSIALAVYLGIIFGYQPYLNNQVEKLDQEITAYSSKVPAEEQRGIVTFYSQLVNLKKILGSHTLASPSLEWLQENTLSDVYYTTASISMTTRQIKTTGVAKTAEILAAQVQHFQKNADVKEVVLNSVNLATNGYWQFGVTVTLREGFYSAAKYLTSQESPVVSTDSQQAIPQGTSSIQNVSQ